MNRVMLIALLAAVGCEKPSSEGTPAVTSNDGVQLISLGSETAPRQLRYHLAKGRHTPLSMAMDMDMEIAPRPMVMPTLVMSLDLGVQDVKADGSALLEGKITGVRVLDRPGATIPSSAMGPLVEQLGGLVYTCSIASDGAMSGTKVVTELPAMMKDQIPQLLQSIETVTMQLPPVPIGVGAKWTTRRVTKQNGIAITTITTVQLDKLDGDVMHYSAETTLSAPDQTTTQNGIELTMKDIGGGGHGKGTIDLSSMAMVSETTSEFRGKIVAQGQTSNMTVKLRLSIK